jgi:hypothetical protein
MRMFASDHLLIPMSRADFGKLIAEETDKWAKVVKTAGIKPEFSARPRESGDPEVTSKISRVRRNERWIEPSQWKTL